MSEYSPQKKAASIDAVTGSNLILLHTLRGNVCCSELYFGKVENGVALVHSSLYQGNPVGNPRSMPFDDYRDLGSYKPDLTLFKQRKADGIRGLGLFDKKTYEKGVDLDVNNPAIVTYVSVQDYNYHKDQYWSFIKFPKRAGSQESIECYEMPLVNGQLPRDVETSYWNIVGFDPVMARKDEYSAERVVLKTADIEARVKQLLTAAMPNP